MYVMVCSYKYFWRSTYLHSKKWMTFMIRKRTQYFEVSGLQNDDSRPVCKSNFSFKMGNDTAWDQEGHYYLLHLNSFWEENQLLLEEKNRRRRSIWNCRHYLEKLLKYRCFCRYFLVKTTLKFIFQEMMEISFHVHTKKYAKKKTLNKTTFCNLYKNTKYKGVMTWRKPVLLLVYLLKFWS